ETGKRLVSVAILHVLVIRNIRPAIHGNANEFFRLRRGNPAKQQRVRKPEDREIRADADCQRQDGAEGECRTLSKRSHSVADIPSENVEVLNGRRLQKSVQGDPPKTAGCTGPTFRSIPILLSKHTFHFRSELSLKVERKQAQQAPVNSHCKRPLLHTLLGFRTSFFIRAASKMSSMR